MARGLWLARRGRLWLRGAGAGAGAEGKVGRDHRERERSAEGMGRSVEMGGGGRKATTSVYLCRVFLVCFAKAKGGRGRFEEKSQIPQGAATRFFFFVAKGSERRLQSEKVGFRFFYFMLPPFCFKITSHSKFSHRTYI